MQYLKIFIIVIGVVISAIAFKSGCSGPSSSSRKNAEEGEYRFKCNADDHVFKLSLKGMVDQTKSGETRIDEQKQRLFTCPQCGEKEAVEFPERLNDDGTLAN